MNRKSLVMGLSMGISVLGLISICGCASMKQKSMYSDKARSNSFETYFTSTSTVKTFDTLEEAYSFVYEAEMKVGQASGNSIAKGLAAKLSGPAVKGEKPVTVVLILGSPYLTTQLIREKGLEKALSGLISITMVSMVFYEDRAVSVSKFYLDDGYMYTSNSQVEKLRFDNNIYVADYPAGWGIDKAFEYLRKERD